MFFDSIKSLFFDKSEGGFSLDNILFVILIEMNNVYFDKLSFFEMNCVFRR